MADSTTTPGSTTTTPTQRKPRGPIDARTLGQLQKDEEIVLAVKDEMTTNSDSTSKLASHFLDGANTIAITPESVNDLATQIATARTTAGDATESTAGFDDVTDTERSNKEALLNSIRNVQARAKGKYDEYPSQVKILLGR